MQTPPIQMPPLSLGRHPPEQSPPGRHPHPPGQTLLGRQPPIQTPPADTPGRHPQADFSGKPPWADTPRQTPPPAWQTPRADIPPFGRRLPLCMVRILLECILIFRSNILKPLDVNFVQKCHVFFIKTSKRFVSSA